MTSVVVRAPASSANLGAGFDVLGMALTLFADCGLGEAPAGAQPVDGHHPARAVFEQLGGDGPMWMRCDIPMARGLGFSGAARVAAASLAAVQRSGDGAIVARADEILRVTAAHEGHGDNVAASLFGGITAYVDGRAVRIPIGPVVADAAFIAWVPDATTSTETSRRALPSAFARSDAVHNIGRAVQFVTAVMRDDPGLLDGATHDRLHQSVRLSAVPGAATALEAGVAAGAWCGWLSGSGPTIALLCDAGVADAVVAALPAGGHAKVLGVDTVGARVVSG